MTSLDQLSREAVGGMRSAVSQVQPRPVHPVATKQHLARAVLVVVLLIAAASLGLVAVHSKGADQAPASGGLVGPTRVFSPSGLGVRVTLPASWQSVEPGSGFDFTMVGPRPDGPFLLAADSSPLTASTPAQVGSARRQVLVRLGAKIQSVVAVSVAGRPAVRLEYLLSDPHGTVEDTEYDILLAPTPFGTLSVYPRALIVLGQPVGGSDQRLLAQIGDTIQVSP